MHVPFLRSIKEELVGLLRDHPLWYFPAAVAAGLLISYAFARIAVVRRAPTPFAAETKLVTKIARWAVLGTRTLAAVIAWFLVWPWMWLYDWIL